MRRASPRFDSCAGALPARRAHGFTLLELLASVAVFMLILGMLSQIFNSTVAATQASRKQMDATQQNRMVIDALRDDLTSLSTQDGAATVFVKEEPVSSSLVFLTRSRGPQGALDLRCMAVSYRLDGNRLVRRSIPVTWADGNLLSAALAAVDSPTESVLSPSILRFHTMVNLDDGTSVPLSASGHWKTNTISGDAVPKEYSALLLAQPLVDPDGPRVRSLTVSIAAVDPVSLDLPNTGDIAGVLGDPDAGEVHAEAWQEVISSSALDAFPDPAVNSLRVSQMTITLGP